MWEGRLAGRAAKEALLEQERWAEMERAVVLVEGVRLEEAHKAARREGAAAVEA